MPKGGIRPRSSDGSLAHLLQPKWKQGKTRTIRVPKVLAEQLLEIAHHIDEGGLIELTQDKNALETSPSVDLTQDIKAELEQIKSNQAQARALLQNAITPRQRGGNYAANNATGIKRLVEQALTLLRSE